LYHPDNARIALPPRLLALHDAIQAREGFKDAQRVADPVLGRRYREPGYTLPGEHGSENTSTQAGTPF
jgi:hypothetical protein